MATRDKIALILREVTPADEEAVIALWDRCELSRPWNDPRKDIQRKRAVQPDLFLVAEIEGEIVGTVMAGYEGHRGWLNYVGVDPAYQRRGIGRALLHEAESRLRALGCPKINLQVRMDNPEAVAFYQTLGYDVYEAVSMGKRLENDTRPAT